MRISDWSSDVCSSDLLDHVDQFLDHVDVRGFQHVLADLAQAIDARRARLWRAAGGGLREQIVAQRLRACRVQEVHKLDLAALARLGVAGDHHRHRAVLRSEEHTSELQSLMSTSYAVFCL